jgi:hypothetical protein
MVLTITRKDAEKRSSVAMTSLGIIAEWLGFVGFICFTLAGVILACVFYPLILCAQWGSALSF